MRRLWTTVFIMVVFVGQASAGDCDLSAAVAAVMANCADPIRGTDCITDGGRLLHAQANLPTALPAHNLVIAALGDAAFANAAPLDTPLLPAPPVTVTPTANVNVRRGPSADAERLGAAENGAALFADALDPSGEWVRVAYRNSWGWVSREYVAGAMATLPTIAPTDFGAFAALTVDTGDCGAVLLQPPRVTELRVQVNDDTLWINNAVVLDTHAGALRVTALDGGVRLPDGVRVPRGFSATHAVDRWQSPRPMSAAQMARYAPLAALAPPLVNEPISLPTGAYIRPGTHPADSAQTY
jgi:hypothetical protein